MTRYTRIALLLVSALVPGTRAAAQTVPSPLEYVESVHSLHVFGGGLLTDPDVNITDSTSVGFGPRSAPVLGLRYQLRASGPISVEASVGWSPSERKLFAPEYVDDSTRVVGRDLGVSVPATLVMADIGVRFHFTGDRTWNRLAPFAVGTGGLVADIRGTFDEEAEAQLADDDLFRFGPTFAVGAGLGTDWFPARNVSVRLEAQGRLWRMEPPQSFVLPRTDRSEWNPVGGLTVGAAYHF